MTKKVNILKCISELNMEVLLEDEYLNLPKVEWWLLKYESAYKDAISIIEAIPSDYTFPRIGDRYTSEFQLKDLYELLEEVTACHRNETYFKKQLEIHNEVNTSVVELNSWLKSSTTSQELAKFTNLFADNRTLTGYNFNLKLPTLDNCAVKLNPLDFKYSIEFNDILEKSKKVIIHGNIKHIDDIVSLEEETTITPNLISKRPAYKKRTIVISDYNDKKSGEHLVRFVHDKVGLLKNTMVGQRVEVYAELKSRVQENEKGVKEQWETLIGWDIKQL